MPRQKRPRPQVIDREKLADGSFHDVERSWDEAFASTPAFLQWLQEHLHLQNDALSKETDRAAAVLAPAFLDSILGDLLEAFFIEGEVAPRLLQPDRPLGTFSARIDLAQALGFLSERAARDLRLIGRIRNDFAHDLATGSFETLSIKNRCRELSAATRWSLDFGTPGNTRTIFLQTVATSVAEIANGMRYVKRRTLVPPIESPSLNWKG